MIPQNTYPKFMPMSVFIVGVNEPIKKLVIQLKLLDIPNPKVLSLFSLGRIASMMIKLIGPMKTAKKIMNNAVEHAINVVIRFEVEDMLVFTIPNVENINMFMQHPIYPVKRTFFGVHLLIIEKLANVARKFIIDSSILIESIEMFLLFSKSKEE